MKRNLLLVLFSVFCFSAAYAGAGEMNVYASKLRVENVNDATNEVTVSYFLNAPATGLEFQLLRADGSVYRAIAISDASKYTKGAHELTIDLSTARGGEYKWALKVSGTTVVNYTKAFEDKDKFGFWGPRGVAVDNSFESDYFGNVYVTNFNSGGGAGDVITRLTQTGVYALDAGMNPINTSAYQGGLTWGGNSGIQWAIARPCVGPDGTVYISVGSATNSGVWMMDPANPTTFSPVFGGSHTSSGTTKNGETVIHNSIMHCYVEGIGEDRKLYTFDNTDAISGDIFRYDIGNLATPWTAAPSATAYNDATNGNKIQGGDCSIAPDGNGGWWISQYRAGTGSADIPVLIHVTDGAIDYNSGTTIKTSYQGGMAVSVDGKTLAIGTTRSTTQTNIAIYNVSYNANTNAPTLTLRTTIAWTGQENRNAKGLAFDVANNLYVVDNNKEVGAVFATHGSTEFTTPAPSTRTITLAQKTQSAMAGTYKIGNGLYPEIAYTSLNDAATDVNAWGMSADVTLLICDDLTENNNSGLVNTSDHTLTIRPDGTTKRSITFGDATDNEGPSGHVVIGYDLTGWNSTDTKNVIIDGSYNGEGQYLEFQAGSIGGRTIVFYGNVTDTEVRNCRIINNRASGTNYAIELRTTQLAGGNPPTDANKTDKAPVGIRIENCFVQVTGSGNAQAININGAYSKTSAGMPKDTYIGGCEIIANLRGIFINGAINANIEGNIFRVNATGGYNTGIIYGNNSSGDINIRNNQFLQIATKNTNSGTYGIHAVFAQSGGNWKIENNLFTGFDAGVKDAKGNLVGIFVNSTPSSVTIQHNTMVMPAFTKAFTSPDLLSTTPVTLIRVAAGTPVIKNNILISHETTCVNSLIRGNLNANCLNNVYYSAGGSGVIVDGATACANWSEFTTKYSTQAASSQNVDVTFSGAEPYMLSAESANEAKLEVPNIDGLTTDIEGNTRYTPTHAGCYDLAWTLTLDETATNNSDAIEAKDERVMDVLLKRHFTDATAMYTLVLPFDLTDEQLQEAFGAGYKLSVMTDAYWKVEGEVLYLRFDYVNHLEAGMPALLQVGEAVTEDILFRDVTIDASDPENGQMVAVMRGLYDKTTVLADIKSYYLGTGRYLYQYTSDKETKGFRSYFYFPDFESATPCSARIVYRDEVVTDDEPASVQPTADAPQKLIRDGKVVIVVDGVEYDALGRKIQ